MAYLLKGALIEYGTDLIGPIPNVVIFQFNPESLTRSMKIPPRPTGPAGRENTQAGEKPLESISFKAQFSAADELNDNKAAIDAIGKAIFGGKGDSPGQAIPREKYPKIIFIWGLTRVLPVVIDSMRISELEYDSLLNPIRAEVDIELTVNAVDSCSDDKLAKGALKYSTIAKEAQAIANLANSAEQIVELIPI
jgi:hypothetical protein